MANHGWRRSRLLPCGSAPTGVERAVGGAVKRVKFTTVQGVWSHRNRAPGSMAPPQRSEKRGGSGGGGADDPPHTSARPSVIEDLTSPQYVIGPGCRVSIGEGREQKVT